MMKSFLVLCVLLVAPAVLATSLSLCSEHPLINFKLPNWKVTLAENGLKCFTDPENTQCFVREDVEFNSMFLSGAPDTTGVAAEKICGDIAASCIDPNHIPEFVKDVNAYINNFAENIVNVFKYNATEDNELIEFIQSVIDKVLDVLREFTNEIPADLVILGTNVREYVLNIINTTVTDEVANLNLPALLTEYIEIAFNFIEEIADDFLVAAEPILVGVGEYVRGIACTVADADIMQYMENDVLKIQANLFTFLSEKVDEMVDGSEIGDFFFELRGKIAATADEIIAKIVELADGIHEQIGSIVQGFFDGVDIDELLQEHVSVNALIKPIAAEFDACLLPADGTSFCVPFLDEVMWVADLIKLAFTGNFKAFQQAITDGPPEAGSPERSALNPGADVPVPTTESTRKAVVQKLQVVRTASTTTSTEGGVDVLARAQNSKINSYTTDDEKKEDEIFGFPAMIVYAAAGGVALVLLTAIICCCCCGKDGDDVPHSMPPMAGPPMSMGRPMAGPPMSMGRPPMGRPPMGMNGPPRPF